MMRRHSSGSRAADSCMDSLTSQNSTVTCLRSPSIAARELRICSARWLGVYVLRSRTGAPMRAPHSGQNFAPSGDLDAARRAGPCERVPALGAELRSGRVLRPTDALHSKTPPHGRRSRGPAFTVPLPLRSSRPQLLQFAGRGPATRRARGAGSRSACPGSGGAGAAARRSGARARVAPPTTAPAARRRAPPTGTRGPRS